MAPCFFFHFNSLQSGENAVHKLQLWPLNLVSKKYLHSSITKTHSLKIYYIILADTERINKNLLCRRAENN